MPVPSRKSAASIFAASCFAVAGLMFGGAAGCEREDERADRAVEETIRGTAAEQGEAAVAGFEKASKEAGASPAATAHAKALLAQAQVEQARQILHKVDAKEAEVARLVFEIGNLAAQVQSSNALIAGYQELAPKATGAVGKLLTEQRGAVQGDGASATLTEGLPALSGATEQAGKLTEEIGGLEAKIAELRTARAAADKKASDLLRQSRRTTGRKSVDLFSKSAAEAKRAAALANQADGLDHKLRRLKQDLALAEAQSKQLESAVTSLTSRIEQNEKSQEEIQALIENHRALQQSLVYGGDAPPPAAAPAEDAAPAAADEAPADEAPVDDAGAEPATATDAGAADETSTGEVPDAGSAPEDSNPGDTGDTAEPSEDDAGALGTDVEATVKLAAFIQAEDAPPAEGSKSAADPTEAVAAEGDAPAEGEAPVEVEAPAEGGPPAEAPVEEAAQGGTSAEEGAAAGNAAAAAANAAPVSIVTNATMADKGKELSQLVEQITARRAEAAALLASASSNYDAAIADADKLLKVVRTDMSNGDYKGMPQHGPKGSWAWMAEVYSLAKLNLQKANVQHMIASLHRDGAASHAWRQQMITMTRPVLLEAQLQMPAGIEDPRLDAALAEHIKLSEEAYDATDKLLADVIDAPGGAPSEEEAKKQAQIARVVAAYGRSQLARIKNDNDTADRLLTGARQAVTSGALPAEQYPVYIRAALGLIELPVPTTAPAEPEPATQPVEEAAPAEAPAEDEAAPATAPADAAPPAQPGPSAGQAPPGGPPGAGGMPTPPGYGQAPPGSGPPGPGGGAGGMPTPPGYGQAPPGSGPPGPGGPGGMPMPPGYGQAPPGSGPPGQGGGMPTPPDYGQPPGGGQPGPPPGQGMPPGGMPGGPGGPPGGGQAGPPPGQGMPPGGMPGGPGAPPAQGGPGAGKGGKSGKGKK